MILIPKYKDIYAPEPIITRTGLTGYYKMEATNVETGKTRVLADWFPNLMLTAGLNRMTDIGSYSDRCFVGTGNTPPVATDTALEGPVSSGESAQGSVRVGGSSDGITPPHYVTATRNYIFPQALEATLAEVGVGATSGSGEPLMSRALILDGGLNPITITILAIEILTVTHELRGYGPTDDLIGTVTIDSIVYDTITRLSRLTQGTGSTGSWQNGLSDDPIIGNGSAMGAYNGDIGGVAGEPAGSFGGDTSSTEQAYSNLSFTRDYDVFWNVGAGNLTNGIRSVRHNARAGGEFQTQFNGPSDEFIAKDINKTLNLTFRHTWGPFTG